MIAAIESLAGYLRTLTDGRLLAIKTLSMDMNAGYIRAARIHSTSAVEKIAFDRFHVAKQLGEVVDKTRQNEHPHLLLKADTGQKEPGFLWQQYSDKWMTESRQEKLMWLRAQMKLTSQCWALKRAGKGYLEQAMERGKDGVTGRDGWRWRLTVTFP